MRVDVHLGLLPCHPLLFAMGAEAAAFSALRRAVFTEGASDMILLPSLIRRATKLLDLGYQIAPGIASYNGSGLELEEAAGRVAYLLDGDKGGSEHRRRLTAEMGIDDERILQLPVGKTAEDLVDRECHLAVMNHLIKSAGHADHVVPISAAGAADGSVHSVVSAWCDDRGIKTPSKTAVAKALVGEFVTPLRLSEDAYEVLPLLRRQILEILG